MSTATFDMRRAQLLERVKEIETDLRHKFFSHNQRTKLECERKDAIEEIKRIDATQTA